MRKNCKILLLYLIQLMSSDQKNLKFEQETDFVHIVES